MGLSYTSQPPRPASKKKKHSSSKSPTSTRNKTGHGKKPFLSPLQSPTKIIVLTFWCTYVTVGWRPSSGISGSHSMYLITFSRYYYTENYLIKHPLWISKNIKNSQGTKFPPFHHSVLLPPFLNAAATAAKSLQSCLILCDPRDGSPPGCTIPGILQARTLEWVAISFLTGASALNEDGTGGSGKLVPKTDRN